MMLLLALQPFETPRKGSMQSCKKRCQPASVDTEAPHKTWIGVDSCALSAWGMWHLQAAMLNDSSVAGAATAFAVPTCNAWGWSRKDKYC